MSLLTKHYGKTTCSREQLSTEQVQPDSLLFPIPCSEFFHDKDRFTVLLHDLKQIHQLLKGSGVATVYLDFKVNIEFHSISFELFPINLYSSHNPQKNPALMGRCQETRNPPNCTS